MKTYPGGLSLQQLHKVINAWRETDLKTLEGILRKLPYFELVGEGVWSYNPTVRVLYEDLLKRFLSIINKQKERWHRSKAQWKNKYDSLQKHYQEALSGKQEAAAALAEKNGTGGRHEHLLTQMAEKDLLLSLRKREIPTLQEHINKLVAKSQQHSLPVPPLGQTGKGSAGRNLKTKGTPGENPREASRAFSPKLQQYKEKDRENKAKIVELKEQYSTRIAELQNEIVELKQKAERGKNLPYYRTTAPAGRNKHPEQRPEKGAQDGRGTTEILSPGTAGAGRRQGRKQ